MTRAPKSSDTTEAGVSPRPLSMLGRGDRGVIHKVGWDDASDHGDHRAEIERRLLELGFVEDALIELLHEGLMGRDPIVVRIDDMRVALRRREAEGILVRLEGTRA